VAAPGGSYDCIVVGLGAAGASTAYHLASRGASVLGLEQFDLNHPFGSSHGKTRITRTTYSEGLQYVPLVTDTFALWKALERHTGLSLLWETGTLMIGPREGRLVDGALASAREFDLPHELLDSKQVAGRFPVFAPARGDVGLWDPRGATLFPERCLEAFTRAATERGADLRFGEPVLRWASDGPEVRVETARGRYSAPRLVLAAGSWLRDLVPELSLPLTLERQVVAWFRPTVRDLVQPTRMPAFLWEKSNSDGYYGVPDFGDGPKIAANGGQRVDRPEQTPRAVTEADLEPIRRFVRDSVPGAQGPVASSVTCIYTNAPDRHFVWGFHPKQNNVLLFSACSGHGFKFSVVLGLCAARAVLGEDPGYDLSSFSPARFDRDPTAAGAAPDSYTPGRNARSRRA